jgi:hypothetical protein
MRAALMLQPKDSLKLTFVRGHNLTLVAKGRRKMKRILHQVPQMKQLMNLGNAIDRNRPKRAGLFRGTVDESLIGKGIAEREKLDPPRLEARLVTQTTAAL